MFIVKGPLSSWVVAAGFALGGLAGTLLSGPFLAAPPAPRAAEIAATASIATTPSGRGPYAAEVLRVADGDTFEARVQVWPGIAITTLVRLRDIDTPELKARCPQERAKAEAARAKLAAILSEGSVEISRVGLDKFGGRIDAAAATRSTPDVSAAILRAGLGRSYAGGRREGWCS
jgi:endonuclease YncB( thermonuclease family)